MQTFTIEEVAKHTTLDTGIWIVINNTVYDISGFVTDNVHFTTKVIEPYYGKDATYVFNGVVHSKFAKKLLTKYKIGQIPYVNPLDSSINAPDQRAALLKFDDIHISRIFIYPIKGCKCISVKSAYLGRDGLQNDRVYAWCNKKTKKVVNQLRFPILSKIRISFIDANVENFDKGIVINDMVVPLNVENEILVNWKSSKTLIKVHDQGPEISKWITNYINFNNNEYMLVRVTKNNYRKASDHYKVDSVNDGKNKIVGFQNYCSVSLTSEQSLAELNKRCKLVNAKKMNPFTWYNVGFRMNIVMDKMPAPNSEDFMKKVTFFDDKKDEQDVKIVWSKRRYLCAVPQVNQMTAVVTREPMNTLTTYRMAPHLNDYSAPPDCDSVYFGSLYAIKQGGKLYVGQKAQPLVHNYASL